VPFAAEADFQRDPAPALGIAALGRELEHDRRIHPEHGPKLIEHGVDRRVVDRAIQADVWLEQGCIVRSAIRDEAVWAPGIRSAPASSVSVGLSLRPGTVSISVIANAPALR